MTTKYKLADQALRILSGGDIQNATDTQIREMMEAISQARDKVVADDILQLIYATAEEDFDIPGDYISTYDDIEVKWDEKRKVMYSKLPAKYIILPRNLGVYSVGLTEDMFNTFIPVSPGHNSLYNGLASSGLEGRVGFWLGRNKIFYKGIDRSDNIEGVTVRLVVESSYIDDEDEAFPIPPNREMDVIKMALELYMPQKQVPNDEINDNIDE